MHASCMTKRKRIITTKCRGAGGLGVSRYNDEGNWSALFAMMFKDSHNEWQPAMGYGWEKGWYLDNAKDFRLGLGAAAGITARDDFANYVPLPFIFPLFSAGYKRVTVQFTYIPGTYNNGNVLFASAAPRAFRG